MSKELLERKLRKTFHKTNKKIQYTKQFSYEGQIYQFQRHGQGILYLDDESYYKGEFQNGELNGKGEYFLAFTGWHYCGYFLKGEKHGEGVLTKGDYIFKGRFQNGIKDGQFEEYYNDKGYKQIGTYIRGILQGNFKKLKLSDSTEIINCNMINGKKNGFGQYEDDFFKYEGNFQEDKKQGKGKLIDKTNDITYNGLFENDQCIKVVNQMEASLLVEVQDKNGSVQQSELKIQNEKYKLESSKEYIIKQRFIFYEELKQNSDNDLPVNKNVKKKNIEDNIQTNKILIEEESNRKITYSLVKINQQEDNIEYNIDFYQKYQECLEKQEQFQIDFNDKELVKPQYRTTDGLLDIRIIFPNNIQSGNYELIIKDQTQQNENFIQLEDIKFQIDIISKSKN